MRKIFALALAGAILSACGLYSTPTLTGVSQKVSVGDQKILMAPKTIVMGALAGSGQTGEVVLTDLGEGKTQVTITMTGRVSTVAQPAHIHTGSCPTPGAVRYPLSDVVAGRSETVVEADMASLFGTEAMAVNIHRSATEASVFVSCGDLK